MIQDKKPVVRKFKIKEKPVVVAEPVVAPADVVPPSSSPTSLALFNKSTWLLMRRNPKEKPLPIVWEHVEDISDDENDTPQAAGKRLSLMKKTRDQMQRQYNERKFDEYQSAGLFLNWSKPKQIQVHPEQY
jgi:hypothetical protein